MEKDFVRLVDAAEVAQEKSYAPYSDYAVGAAVLTEDGLIYSACNIECKPTTNTLHAEQRAIAKAVEQGHRNFEALALKSQSDNLKPPCGNCRNMVASIDYDMKVIIVGDDEVRIEHLPDLLPEAYLGSRHNDE